MKKELVLERLQMTIDCLSELEDRFFSPILHIGQFDKENWHPIIASIEGWYPVWFPDCDLRYQELTYDGVVIVKLIPSKSKRKTVKEVLSEYHGLSLPIIEHLFDKKPLFELKNDGTRLSAIESFKKVRHLIGMDILHTNFGLFPSTPPLFYDAELQGLFDGFKEDDSLPGRKEKLRMVFSRLLGRIPSSDLEYIEITIK